MGWTFTHRGAPQPRRPWRFRPALLDAMRRYTGRDLTKDLGAGLVVGVVAIPLAVAFAIASGADPHAGLVTVVIAGAIVAILGGTRLGVSGPTSSFVTVLAATAATGLPNLFLAVFLAGVLLVLAGVFRLGTVLKLIPYKVTTGFTAGIALTMVILQVPDLLGIAAAGAPAAPLARLEWSWLHVGQLQLSAPLLGLATVLGIAGLKRFFPRIPGPAVMLVVLTGLATWLHFSSPTVGDRFPVLDASIPKPHLPALSLANIQSLLPTAFIIAFLGAVESLSTAVVADGMTGERHDSNQELVAQGVANIASPLFGGLASVGALARTATNITNGARSPIAALVHVLVVLVVLLAAGPLVAHIPLAVLGGILVVAAWNMSQRRQFLQFFRMPRADAGVMATTFALTVVFGLAPAILVGLLLASFLFMSRMSEMAHVELVNTKTDDHPPGHSLRDAEIPHGVQVYSIDGPFFFGAADRFSDTMARVSKPPRVVILRMRAVPYMDATGLNALETAIKGLQRRGSRVMLAGIQSQPLDLMERSRAVRLVGDGNLFHDTTDALAAARAEMASPAGQTDH